MWLEPEALKSWDKLCPHKSLKELRLMVKRSAPVSHPQGNRRFRDLVFRIQGTTVLQIGLFETVGDCDTCLGRGYTTMVDDFTGDEVRVPCHECEDRKNSYGRF